MSELSIVRSKDLQTHVQRCVSALTHVAGTANVEEAQKRMLLAFSQSASPARLRECSGESIAYAIALSAISGLYPGGPHPDVWMIPREIKNDQGRKVWTACWQMSARGHLRLARRSGWEVVPRLVFEADSFTLDYGTQPRIEHRPSLDVDPSWDALRLGYVTMTDLEGRVTFEILRKKEIVKRRNKAKTQKFWNEWPLEMARKTLLSWAGARELWPMDEPSRYAIHADALAQADDQKPPAVPVIPATLAASDFGESPDEAESGLSDDEKAKIKREEREASEDAERQAAKDGKQ